MTRLTIMTRSITRLMVLIGALLLSPNALAAGFELQPMVGYSFVNLTGLSEDKFNQAVPSVDDPGSLQELDPNDASVGAAVDAALVPVEGDGPSVGLAAQFNFWAFVIGARYAFTTTSDFDLHTVTGELGLRLGGKVALYGRLGLGYTFQGGLPDGINTNGFVGAIAGGLDVRPTDGFSIGLGLDLDILALSQTGEISTAISTATGGMTANEDTLGELDGSAIGFQFRPQLHVTWHL